MRGVGICAGGGPLCEGSLYGELVSRSVHRKRAGSIREETQDGVQYGPPTGCDRVIHTWRPGELLAEGQPVSGLCRGNERPKVFEDLGEHLWERELQGGARPLKLPLFQKVRTAVGAAAENLGLVVDPVLP
jgi:hypothetical protein